MVSGELLKPRHVCDAFTGQAGFDMNEGLLPLVGGQMAQFTPQFLQNFLARFQRLL